jgi:serine/threonine protein kinase
MIDHPFIIKVIEIIPLEDKQGMVMELADNGTFKMMIEKRIKEKKPFSEVEIMYKAANFAFALLGINGRGVQHRDMRPTNILIHN